jgi:ketosteroid isomerase-like protein
MTDFRTIADRVEIEALRAEFSDCAMMRDYPRLASLFAEDGALRMPNIPVELEGREQIRAWGMRAPTMWRYFIQTSHPGVIVLEGDTASGRAYMQELIELNNGSSHQNIAIYHDEYVRTADGWKFRERVYEVRYEDSAPVTGEGAIVPVPAQPGSHREEGSPGRLSMQVNAPERPSRSPRRLRICSEPCQQGSRTGPGGSAGSQSRIGWEAWMLRRFSAISGASSTRSAPAWPAVTWTRRSSTGTRTGPSPNSPRTWAPRTCSPPRP